MGKAPGNTRGDARHWVIAQFTRLLTKPLTAYEVRVPTNPELLKKVLQKGDIILVEGDQRVSQVIRYLTQSSWSHSAIYIGDELLKEKYGQRQQVADRYGREAEFLLLEALVGEGVVTNVLAKYRSYNIRICRPHKLHREDLDRVLESVIAHLGDAYDIQHIFDLGRFFFPVSLVPRRWRRAALHFGSGKEHEVICSSMIARAFHTVGYPVLPQVEITEENPAPAPWWRNLPFRNAQRLRARFREQDPALITPRDFDLSPYFDVIKLNHLGTRFDYRQIEWDDQQRPQIAVDEDALSA